MIESTDALAGLKPSGAAPSTRIQDAESSRQRIERLIAAEQHGRSKRRALVKGLVDGNPPYSQADKRRAGRADDCNVNWRAAEFFLRTSLDAFYDIFSESHTFTTVQLENDTDGEQGRIVTEEFQRLQAGDRCMDYNMQNSQHDTVLYGIGPLHFCDEYDWRPVHVPCKDLLVPEHAKSDIETWDEAAILSTYLPHQLYSYIADPAAAAAMGWDVEMVRQAIIHAHPRSRDGGRWRYWEWHQQQLKTNSYAYSAESNIIEVASYFVREFGTPDNHSGSISHAIVLSPSSSSEVQGYLYFKSNRYDAWSQCIHPMYYDNLGGGEHHSVAGLGIKMFASLEFANRLFCNMADKAFAPKTLFRPSTPQVEQTFSLVRLGDYARLPAGWDMMQTPAAGMLDEAMVMHRSVMEQLAANLSSYRQNLMTKEGNPLTATEVNIRAGEQARLGKTQISRYYTQLDWLYAEKYRRAVNCKDKHWPGGAQAIEFQKRCRDRGVPLSAMRKPRLVQATRIVGQGSEFMRQQALQFLLGLAGMLPASGREALIRDAIASRAGQSMVERYYPGQPQDRKRQDHLAFAMVQVGAMKDGVPAIVTDSQDHELYATTFLQAGAEAIQSSQPDNTADIIKFLDQAGPAIMAHVQKLGMDPSKKDVAAALAKQLEQLAKMADELKNRLAQQNQQQADLMARKSRMLSDDQIRMQEMMLEQRRKDREFVLQQRRKNSEAASRIRDNATQETSGIE